MEPVPATASDCHTYKSYGKEEDFDSLFDRPTTQNVPVAQAPVRQAPTVRGADGLLIIHDLLRFDVARGMRDGRWTFGVDFARAFWSVL